MLDRALLCRRRPVHVPSELLVLAATPFQFELAVLPKREICAIATTRRLTRYASAENSSLSYYGLSIVKWHGSPGRPVAGRATWDTHPCRGAPHRGACLFDARCALYHSRVGTALRCYGWGPPVACGGLNAGVAFRPPKERGWSGLPTASDAGRAPAASAPPCSWARAQGGVTPAPSCPAPRPSRPSRARWRSWRRPASCRPARGRASCP